MAIRHAAVARRRPPAPGEGAERRRPHARIGVAPRGPFEIGGCARRESSAQAEGRRVRGSFDRGLPLGAVSGHAENDREPRPVGGVVHGRLCR